VDIYTVYGIMLGFYMRNIENFRNIDLFLNCIFLIIVLNRTCVATSQAMIIKCLMYTNLFDISNLNI
jgi:hypothetical protein